MCLKDEQSDFRLTFSSLVLRLHQRQRSRSQAGRYERQGCVGKSTMRPLQRILAGKLNFPWEELALISPDIWRKFLLDYGSLGPTSS